VTASRCLLPCVGTLLNVFFIIRYNGSALQKDLLHYLTLSLQNVDYGEGATNAPTLGEVSQTVTQRSRGFRRWVTVFCSG